MEERVVDEIDKVDQLLKMKEIEIEALESHREFLVKQLEDIRKY